MSVVFVDMDGTLTRSNLLSVYVALLRTHPSWLARAWRLAVLVALTPMAWVTDHISRTATCHLFYAQFAGLPVSVVEAGKAQAARTALVERLDPAVVSRLEAHAARGDTIVLLTGNFAPVARLLAHHLPIDEVLAATPKVRSGRYTRRLDGAPIVGATKARLAREVLARLRAAPGQSYAYADHHTDIALLQLVGHPVAVRPDPHLRRTAARLGWECLGGRD